jgi:hypothetical protein
MGCSERLGLWFEKKKKMSPKQWIKYVRKLERRNLAICDGATQEFGMGMFDILYPLFAISGISLFIILLTRWEWLMNKIRRR